MDEVTHLLIRLFDPFLGSLDALRLPAQPPYQKQYGSKEHQKSNQSTPASLYWDAPQSPEADLPTPGFWAPLELKTFRLCQAPRSEHVNPRLRISFSRGQGSGGRGQKAFLS